MKEAAKIRDKRMTTLNIITKWKILCSCDPLNLVEFAFKASFKELETGNLGGPALMCVWSKTLSLTASCLSPLAGLEFRPGV